MSETKATENLYYYGSKILLCHSRLSSSIRITTYALCGFANFGSLGILLGGLAVLVPERRDEVLRIAPRSIVSGTLVTLITAALVGLVGQF